MFRRNWTKYNATKIQIDWITFRSKIEARAYNFLKDRYNIIEIEPVFKLQDKFEFEWKKYREINYKSDFLIEFKNWYIIIEMKWFETPEWRLKKKLFLYRFNEIKKDFDKNLYFIIAKSIKDLEKQINLLEAKK